MGQGISFRPMRAGDAAPVSRLVRSTFLEFIAPTYRPRGVRWFLRHNTPGALRGRLRKGQLVLVAEAKGRPAGVIALRGGIHVSLLFVDPGLHGRGIGRGLLRAACERLGDGADTVTVNSSDYAVPFYRSLGFEPVAGPRYRKGMKITPMWRFTRSSPGPSGP